MSSLREVAERATDGPWVAHANHRRAGGIPVIEYTVVPDMKPSWIVADVRDGDEADARFIATFDPPTVLALLDVVDAALSFANATYLAVEGRPGLQAFHEPGDAARLRRALARLPEEVRRG